MTDHTANIRAAIQALLEDEGDGYVCGQIVVGMGLERINSDGMVEAIPWVWAPLDQPDWQTTALLEAAIELRAQSPTQDL